MLCPNLKFMQFVFINLVFKMFFIHIFLKRCETWRPSFSNPFSYFKLFTDRCGGFGFKWSTQDDTFIGNASKVFQQIWMKSLCRDICVNDTTCNGINYLQERGICVLVASSDNSNKMVAPGWLSEVFQCQTGRFFFFSFFRYFINNLQEPFCLWA